MHARLEIIEEAGKLQKLAHTLHPTTLQVLQSMYTEDKLQGTESATPLVIDRAVRVSVEQGALLHRLLRRLGAKRCLEIGFAYGFSTVWILDALRLQDGSEHIAVDPFEKTGWHGIGLAQVERLSFGKRFKWVSDYSIHVLSDLIRNKERFDFIYIDGNHRFDDVLVDFYLSDQVLRAGGLIVLDDMWMNSVKRVASFVFHNRAYELGGTKVPNVSVFQKLRDDDREWTHYVNF
jgi:predicted O-methyltransferase YrrM